MPPVIEAAGYAGLARFSVGLRLRAIIVVIGFPLVAWLEWRGYALQFWLQRVLWVLTPISGFILVTGANGFGARSAGLGLWMSTWCDAYAGLMGFYDSEVSRMQVPYATFFANVLALIGVMSMLSAVRATARDADADTLARRAARAGLNVLATLICVTIAWWVNLRASFDALPGRIIGAVAIAFAAVALLHTISVIESTRTLRYEEDG